jgi:4-hydroxybenzoate polyprenyltransferase
VHGLFYLLHPGPSVLVTATFVAVAGLAMRAAPSPLRVLQLVLLMLPIQFAIGVVNDLADVRGDAAGKPHKPLVRGAVGIRAASVLAVVLALAGLVSAATISLPVLALSTGGLAAGLAYDLGARRTPLSLLPWWGGVLMLPLAAFASAGRLDSRLWAAVPLTFLIALSLHCANALPDIDGDSASGRRSTPVLLGPTVSYRVMATSLAFAAALALTVLRPTSTPSPLLVAAVALTLVLVAGSVAARLRRPFPVLATGTAVLAVAWLAGVALA